jgi:hypothetical protein
MQVIQAPRASAILYGLLVGQKGGKPWLLPANICPIVPITFMKAGVPFHFVDISPVTLQIDLDQAEALIRQGDVGGLLYAHTYGERSTPNEFFESLKQISPDLLIVDDRCLCIPDLTPDPANRADVQLYSTGYAKIVELNFGGYAFMSDSVEYQAPHLPFQAAHHEEIERSYKEAVEYQARFIYRDCDWLETDTPVPAWELYLERIERRLIQSLEQRIALNQIYADRLPVEIQLPGGFQTWRFNLRVKNKRQILEKIFAAGLFASSHYASLAGIMSDGDAPHAAALAEDVINLFNDHHYTTAQAEQTCTIILENLV